MRRMWLALLVVISLFVQRFSTTFADDLAHGVAQMVFWHVAELVHMPSHHWGDKSMKMRATIEVEFEVDEGHTEDEAQVALIRGRSELVRGIEYGVIGAGPTGIKRGSTKATVVSQGIE
jgi:hypothetical protein